MYLNRRVSSRLLVGAVLFLLASPVFANRIYIEQLRAQAAQYEQQADWDRACECYEAILRLDRSLTDVKERYQHCLRRYWQVRRHRDASYRKETLSLDYGQAIQLYRAFLVTLQEDSFAGRKTTVARMFRKGLEELEWALSEPVFCQAHLPGVKAAEIDAFVASLQVMHVTEVPTIAEALKQVREVAMSGYTYLNINASTIVMEFACGACYAVDDYTAYLTPSQLRALCDTLKGQTVGVGIAPMLAGDRIIIGDIVPASSAADVMPPLQRGDLIISVDGRATSQLSADGVLSLLEGATGTTVTLKVDSLSMGEREITLQRRAVFLPSVSFHMKDDSAGYVHIALFHEGTTHELDLALQTLMKAGMKTLLLDLRGNGGGAFEAAIDCARRFLTSGPITSTRHSDPRNNAVYHSRNADALTLPMVALVDGDTASAAEVLAGALKDNKRARLVGQTTFGKGCTQCLLQLPTGKGNVATGGLRLTVAQFFSPRGVPYTGRGVIPDIYVARPLLPDGIATDPQLDEALVELRRP